MTRRNRAEVIISLIAASALAAACYPTNAPPVRTGGFGGAGRVEGGEVSAGLSPSARMFEDVTGMRFGVDPNAVVGITDWAAVEVGGSFAAKQQAMAFAGLRFTIPRSATHGSLAIDFGLGGGAGVGGVRCGNEAPPEEDDEDGEDDGWFLSTPHCEGDPESADGWDAWDHVAWQDRKAGGGYFDLGLTWHVARTLPIFFYVRPRVQVSDAEGVPLTEWFDLGFGPQFKFKRFDFHFGVTPTVYHNDWQTHFLLGFEIGLDFSTR